MKRIMTAVLLSAAVAVPAFAADTPFYAGLQVGDGYIGGFGGYQIDTMFSAEAHYFNYDTVVTAPGKTNNASSIGVAGVAVFPLNIQKVPQLSVFAKVGVERISEKLTGPYVTNTRTKLTVSGGAQYDFNKNMAARLGISVAGYKNDLFAAGIYKF